MLELGDEAVFGAHLTFILAHTLTHISAHKLGVARVIERNRHPLTTKRHGSHGPIIVNSKTPHAKHNTIIERGGIKSPFVTTLVPHHPVSLLRSFPSSSFYASHPRFLYYPRHLRPQPVVCTIAASTSTISVSSLFSNLTWYDPSWFFAELIRCRCCGAKALASRSAAAYAFV